MSEKTSLILHPEGQKAKNEQPMTGLVMEREAGEADLASEVQRLLAEHQRLQPIEGTARVLESGILTGGLLDASDRYGADRVVAALQSSFSHDGDASLHGAYSELIPNKGERRDFVKGINNQDSLMHAVERVNEIGGTQNGSWHLSDQFERARRFDSQGLASRKQRPFGERNTRTQFDNNYETGDFSDTIINQSELFNVPIEEGGDIVDVLGHLRDTYTAGSEKYMAEHQEVMRRVEAAIAERQQPVRSLRDFADTMLANEIRQLEATIDEVENDAQRDMIAEMLESRASEAQQKRAHFDSQLNDIRNEVLQELGAENFEQRVLRAAAEPVHIEDTRDRYKTTVA